MSRFAVPALFQTGYRRIRSRSAALRLTRFGLVGISGVGVNLAVFTALTICLGQHYMIAGPIGIETALCSNYLLNNNWTFADRRRGWATWIGLARYHVASVGGMAINLGVLHLLAGLLGVPPVLANLLGIGVATSWNFTLSLSWTWRRPTPVSATPTRSRAALSAEG